MGAPSQRKHLRLRWPWFERWVADLREMKILPLLSLFWVLDPNSVCFFILFLRTRVFSLFFPLFFLVLTRLALGSDHVVFFDLVFWCCSIDERIIFPASLFQDPTYLYCSQTKLPRLRFRNELLPGLRSTFFKTTIFSMRSTKSALCDPAFHLTIILLLIYSFLLLSSVPAFKINWLYFLTGFTPFSAYSA